LTAESLLNLNKKKGIMKYNRIAITTGDPAGIGPEITTKALRYYQLKPDLIYVVYGELNPDNLEGKLRKITDIEEAIEPGFIYLIEIRDKSAAPGKPSAKTGEIAYSILREVGKMLKLKKLQAVVTAPVSKEMIRKTYPTFIGHTEFFAQISEVKDVIMSFWGPVFNLALLTTHLSLREVSKFLDKKTLINKLRLIYFEVSKIISKPRLALLAQNPHAGEAGAFGQEDEVAKQCLDLLAEENIEIDGPFPADTFFIEKVSHYDLIISSYHDQGLIPFKMVSSEEGVNVTLGLPYVRTSVDHGTAFDIAGKNIASEKSLIAALNFAESLLKKQRIPENNIYSHFASFYDHYMSHVNYQKWSNFILRKYVKHFGKSPELTLELACGTCGISSLLVKKNLQVEASDISGEMLKIASQKPFAPSLSCRGMLDPLPAARYDLVLLIFDSFNYLLTNSQVIRLFNNVYNTINKSGMFIFDITTLKNCEDNFDGFVNLEDRENSYMIHQSDLDYDSKIQTTRLTFFKRKGFLFDRKDEIHEQRIFKTQDIISLINESEFELLGIYNPDLKGNLLKRDPEILDTSYTRLFFILEKNAIPE